MNIVQSNVENGGMISSQLLPVILSYKRLDSTVGMCENHGLDVSSNSEFRRVIVPKKHFCIHGCFELRTYHPPEDYYFVISELYKQVLVGVDDFDNTTISLTSQYARRE